MSSCELQKSNESSNCGCGSQNQTAATQAKKELIIDFLYIDLEICTRCQGAESSLNEAIHEVSELLQTTGYDVKVNSILVENEQQAELLQFLSSPTIRVNGRDIQLEAKESSCESCGTVAGTDIDCRVWVYQGQEYTEPPRELIMNAVLQAVYGGTEPQENREAEYMLPDNLKRFFAAKRERGSEKNDFNCCGSATSDCC